MFIKGVQINADLSTIIHELKSQLSESGIQRFAKVFDSGDDVMLCCPYHKDGQERRPSAGIRKTDGKFHCLACGKTVELDEMIANCFGYTDPKEGYRWLVQNFSAVKLEKRKPLTLNISRGKPTPTQKATVYNSEEELEGYRHTHPYMYQRGLTDAIIRLFDIGYDKATDSITFPVRYWGALQFGKCLFVARRQIKTKRFDIPKNMEKPLYGLCEIWLKYEEEVKNGSRSVGDNIDKIYVCEGLFDCLRLWCNGKFAVALFGCLFSEYQLTLLQGLPTRHLVLALDNDKAGIQATERLRKRIKTKIVSQVILPEGRKDIGECTDEEIQNLKEVNNVKQAYR